MSATITRPKLIAAFREISGYGVDIETLIDLHEQILPHLDAVSDLLVRAGADHVLGRINPGEALPEDTEIAELITMLVRFRTQAVASVTATLASSIESTIESMVGSLLSDVLAPPNAYRRSACPATATRYGATVASFSQVSSNSRSGVEAAMIPAPARSHACPSRS